MQCILFSPFALSGVFEQYGTMRVVVGRVTMGRIRTGSHSLVLGSDAGWTRVAGEDGGEGRRRRGEEEALQRGRLKKRIRYIHTRRRCALGLLWG